MKQRTPPVKAAANGKMFAAAAAAEEKSSVMGQRKKGKGTRSWLMIDPSGRAQDVEAGKHAIMRRACLPARDLRILDPLLSYPSTILGRERAIVVNLEHIKAIITAQEVLLLNSKNPAVVPIVLDMQRRLPMHLNSLGQQVPGDGGGGFLSDHEGEANHHSRTSRVSSRTDLQSLSQGNVDINTSVPSSSLQMRANEIRGAVSSPARANAGPSVLPFEFRALEVCLEAACSCLDAEATMLEREAYPALDELTSKLSTLNLERVRQIKSRLVAISGRVQKVRDEIEQLLDDDGDMAEMYLTDKLLGVQMEEGTISPASSHGNLNHDFDAQDEAEERLVRPGGEETQFEGGKEISGGAEDFADGARRFESHRSTSSSSTSTAKTQKLDVEELEMLLEAYFVQIEGTLNKLSTLREYVDDTEDYINIMLDDKQNHLLQMGVLLTTATLVVSAFIVVAGIFGMNIHIDLFDENGYKTTEFVWVVCGSIVGCCVIYVAAVAFCKYKRLID